MYFIFILFFGYIFCQNFVFKINDCYNINHDMIINIRYKDYYDKVYLNYNKEKYNICYNEKRIVWSCVYYNESYIIIDMKLKNLTVKDLKYLFRFNFLHNGVSEIYKIRIKKCNNSITNTTNTTKENNNSITTLSPNKTQITDITKENNKTTQITNIIKDCYNIGDDMFIQIKSTHNIKNIKIYYKKDNEIIYLRACYNIDRIIFKCYIFENDNSYLFEMTLHNINKDDIGYIWNFEINSNQTTIKYSKMLKACNLDNTIKENNYINETFYIIIIIIILIITILIIIFYYFNRKRFNKN